MGAEGQAIQDALAKKLGKSRVTVPQVSPMRKWRDRKTFLHYLRQVSRDRLLIPYIYLHMLQIFISGKHIGGCDDLQAAQSTGKLEEMLEELANTPPSSA